MSTKIALDQIESIVIDSSTSGAVSGVDSTVAYQAWIDDNPQVSVFNIIEAAPTWKAITLTRDNITINVLNEAQRVVENPIPIANRGMFMADGVTGITINGDFDLKGEGSRKIGEAGYEANAYNTVASRTGISGPANSAVYFLRCSDISVTGKVINTGESGYLLRNCGNAKMDVSAENCAGAGVELSFPATDGSSSAMPLRENYDITCNGKYINDLKLGAGNGTTVSMAGSASSEVFRNFDIKVNGYRNSREIHQEFNAGSRIEGFTHEVFSRDSLQGAVATQGRNGKVTGVVLNSGTAGSGGVNTGYPSMYGYIGSTGSEDIDVDLQVISTYDDGFTLGTDGAITAGSAVFTSAAASFPASIVGKHIVIEGANPSGAPLEAYVASRDSATQLTLDLDAQVTVSGATYGYGSGCRNPLKFSGTGSVNFKGSTVVGGVFSGLPSEPDAQAVYVANGTGEAVTSGCVIKAPGLIAGATAPVGLEIGTGYSGTFTEHNNIISGFTNNRKGYATASSVKLPLDRGIVQNATPDAAANTYGTDLVITPRLGYFDSVPVMSIEFDAVSAETLTCEIEFVFVDGGSNTVSSAQASSTTVELSAQQVATLHRDNQRITEVRFRAKSSKVSSTARGRLTHIGC